jgi:hypothetical protein
LYFCTSKASKVSTWNPSSRRSSLRPQCRTQRRLVHSRQGGASLAGVSICTFVLVKARKLSYLVRERGGASLA